MRASAAERTRSKVMELLRLRARRPMTITELAESVQRTRSATSQKVAAMRAAGLARTTTGADARTRRIILTARARRIAGKLAAEWRAAEAALRRKCFHDRIAEKLASDPGWK